MKQASSTRLSLLGLSAPDQAAARRTAAGTRTPAARQLGTHRERARPRDRAAPAGPRWPGPHVASRAPGGGEERSPAPRASSVAGPPPGTNFSRSRSQPSDPNLSRVASREPSAPSVHFAGEMSERKKARQGKGSRKRTGFPEEAAPAAAAEQVSAPRPGSAGLLLFSSSSSDIASPSACHAPCAPGAPTSGSAPGHPPEQAMLALHRSRLLQAAEAPPHPGRPRPARRARAAAGPAPGSGRAALVGAAAARRLQSRRASRQGGPGVPGWGRVRR